MNKSHHKKLSSNLKLVAYQQLKAKIIKGDFNFNKRLVERSLSLQLGIGRTPIKHALSMLEQEGLVRIVPRKGIFVQRLSYLEYQDILIVRESLEGLAARLAVDNVSNAHLRQLQNIIEAREEFHKSEETEHQAVSLANIDFHEYILKLSRNTKLIETVHGLYNHLSLVHLKTIEFTGRHQTSLQEHQEIISALETRDPGLSESTMRAHIKSLREDIEREVRKNPTYLNNFELAPH